MATVLIVPVAANVAVAVAPDPVVPLINSSIFWNILDFLLRPFYFLFFILIII